MLNGTEAEAIAAVQKAGADYQAKAPEHRMSSLQDLLAGRPLEIHETLGYALAEGKGTEPVAAAAGEFLFAGQRDRSDARIAEPVIRQG